MHALLLFIIVSYNVENFFCTAHKEESIARVLTHIGEWQGPDIIALQEVENDTVVQRLCRKLRNNEYAYVHYDSPDQRGIDVALIYKKALVDTLRTQAIPVHLGTETTRDILYVCAQVLTPAQRTDTLHLFVCHLPSQRGGKAESNWKRERAKQTIQQAVDSVRTTQPHAKIIVMGDMNAVPKQDLDGLNNRMKGLQGTHKHHGQWACLDQFYTSPTLDSLSSVRIYDAEWIQVTDETYLGLKPNRTAYNHHTQSTFSDHLPIILELLY